MNSIVLYNNDNFNIYDKDLLDFTNIMDFINLNSLDLINQLNEENMYRLYCKLGFLLELIINKYLFLQIKMLITLI
jgi:hypothetical protein